MAETNFQQRVYEKTKQIPRGRVSTYQEIAKAVGRPRAYRAVGNALNKNPTPVEVPCHRVVRSDMQVGGFSRGTAAKGKLLMNEGVLVRGKKVLARVFLFS